MESMKGYIRISFHPKYMSQPKNNKRCIRCGEKIKKDFLACVKPNGTVCWDFTNYFTKHYFND